jgi:hypothetical protein
MNNCSLAKDLFKADGLEIGALAMAACRRRIMVESGSRKRNMADVLCDDHVRLADLANICFWASLAFEEGRPVRGDIFICSSDEMLLARAFRIPQALSLETLVALLTACPHSALAVQAGESGSVVWGIIDSPPLFTVRLRISGIGIIVASIDDHICFVFANGHTKIPNNERHMDCVNLIAAAFSDIHPFPERYKFATRVNTIVASMHRTGHGGALLVVPSGDKSWLKDVKFRFEFDNPASLALRERISESERVNSKAHEISISFIENQSATLSDHFFPYYHESASVHRELVNSTLRKIGQLSAVDGAVVIDDQFNVLGFGAFLSTRPEIFDVLTLNAIDGVTQTIPVADVGGTRHQSSAKYVFAHRQAAAFVASQDGRLSVFAWCKKPPGIVKITNMEHLVSEN